MNNVQRDQGGFLRGSLYRAPQRSGNVPVRPHQENATERLTGMDAKKTVSGGGKKTKILVAVSGSLIVIIAGLAGFFFWQDKSSDGGPGDNTAVSQRIIEKVQGVYLVPEGEEPTVAEIRDKNKLKDQPFFDSAQKGDYLLVYSKAKVALIYRESAGKLVNAGPISTPEDTTAEGENNGSSTPLGQEQSGSPGY